MRTNDVCEFFSLRWARVGQAVMDLGWMMTIRFGKKQQLLLVDFWIF